MLLHLNDFVHKFSVCGFVIATCKRNYVFLIKPFSSVLVYSVMFKELISLEI